MTDTVRVTSCSYFVFKKGEVYLREFDKSGNIKIKTYPDWWGAVAFKNIAEIPQSTKLLIREFETGKLIKTIPIILESGAGNLITYSDVPELVGKRLSLELDYLGSNNIVMTPMSARGRSQLTPLYADIRNLDLSKKF